MHNSSWPEPAPRRSISTVTRPTEMNRFYSHHFPERIHPEGSGTFTPQYPGGQTPIHQQPCGPPRFFREDPAAYCNGGGPVFDPRRFSPPQLDTPPAAQENRAFSFEWDGSAIHNGGMMQQQQPHHVQQQGPLTDPLLPKQDMYSNSFASPCSELNQGIAQLSFPNYDSSKVSPMHPMGHQMSATNGMSQPGGVSASMHCRFNSMSQEGSPHRERIPSETSSTGALLPVMQKRSFVAEKVRTTSVCRKPSLMAQRSQLRSPRVSTVAAPNIGLLTPYTPPPILSPRRSGSGLYCQITGVAAANGIKQEPVGAPDDERDSPMGEDKDDGIGEGPSPLTGGSTETTGNNMRIKVMDDEMGPSGSSRPQRKNGFFYTGADEMELEALRKDSWASSSSAKSTPCITDRKQSWFGSASAKEAEAARKASSVSDCYYECLPTPQQTDANPHINIGKDYQARVKKWADREVLAEERDEIPDRDELVFDHNLIDHLSEEQLSAYEFLACSRAVPRPGRNKELALHLLMENKGNLEAAVMDLLRSDTLDWEQYPIIYNSIYNDSASWTPDQISSFQDALYKTEKDFHQVAQEIGLPVKVCVEWYYTWKKALPDDYRKLRNLRRKRRLLEMQMGVEQQQTILMGQCVTKSARVEEEDDDDSGTAMEMGEGSSALFSGFNDPAGILAHMGALQEGRPRMGSFSSGSPVHKNSGSMYPQTISPSMAGDIGSMQNKYQPCNPRVSKKGAQPAADGFFHCRLCDKCFEKVKSLNAHMKSHAMKARAEAEARSQQLQQPQQPQHHEQQRPQLTAPPPPPEVTVHPTPSPSPHHPQQHFLPSHIHPHHHFFLVPQSNGAPITSTLGVPGVSSSVSGTTSLLSGVSQANQLNVDAQLQLGLANQLFSLNGLQNLTSTFQAGMQQSSHPLSGLHIAPSLGIH